MIKTWTNTMRIAAAVTLASAGTGVWAETTDANHDIERPGVYVETFDFGVNVGQWAIRGAPFDLFPSQGGNPGWYIHCPTLIAPAPILLTTGPSVFTGNYRQRQVYAMGTDLILYHWQWPMPPDTHIYLALRNETYGMYLFADTGARIPQADGRWNSYGVRIPYDSAVLPERWLAWYAGYVYEPGTSVGDKVWEMVITDVQQVVWSYGGPLAANLIGPTDSGADNPFIMWNADSSGVDE